MKVLSFQLTSHFTRETKPIIERMKLDHGLLYRPPEGRAIFSATSTFNYRLKRCKCGKVFKKISLFSPRERECLELFKQGHSAQSTAAILGLAPKTIEHYFENMKLKTGIYSKRGFLNM